MRTTVALCAALLTITAGCSSAPRAAPPSSAAPTTTTTTTTSAPKTPDPALIEPRLRRAHIPDDLFASLGYSPRNASEQMNGSVVMCPERLPTDAARSATKLYSSWINKAAFSNIYQFRFSYHTFDAAAETVQHARKVLDCEPFMFADEGPYTPEKELVLPPLGADAQFAACYTYELMRICQLVISKDDLLSSIFFRGPQTADAAGILQKVGQAAVPLMTD